MLVTEMVAANESASKRLMVVLHGLGDSMEGYRWLPRMLRLPWLNYLLVNAPDPYYTGFSWYDFAGNPGPGVKRSREALTGLLDEQRRAGFPSDQTTLFGFSQGCLMTLDTGLRYGERLAGLVGISGYVFEPERLLAELSPTAMRQRILMTHGTQDNMIPIRTVREQAGRLRAAGLVIEWKEFPKGHTIAGEPELDLIRAFVEAGYSDSR